MNRQAALYMIISTAAFAVMNLVVKYLVHIPALELVFFRAAGSFLLSMGYLRQQRIAVLGRNRKWLVIRSVVGTISLCLFFVAIKLMPLGSAVALRYLAPVIGVLLALIFLREPVRNDQWLYFLIAFAGVGLLSGFDPGITPLGLTVILLSALFSGMVYMAIRRLGTDEHPLVIANYFMGFAMVTGLLGALPNWEWPVGATEWLLLGSLGLVGLVGQLFMTMALQMEATNKIAPLKYLEAVFVLLLSYLWFGDSYCYLALLGIGLIVVGNLLNAFVRRKRRAPVALK